MTKQQHPGDERHGEGVAVQDKSAKNAKSPVGETDENIAIANTNGEQAAQAEPAAKRWQWPSWLSALRAGSSQMHWKLPTKALRVDVIDRADDILMRAEVPGISKERLELTIKARTLVIRGQASTAEAGEYLQRELPAGEFERQLSLPVQVQSEQASATLRNGLLEVVLPKVNKEREQKIAIR